MITRCPVHKAQTVEARIHRSNIALELGLACLREFPGTERERRPLVLIEWSTCVGQG